MEKEFEEPTWEVATSVSTLISGNRWENVEELTSDAWSDARSDARLASPVKNQILKFENLKLQTNDEVWRRLFKHSPPITEQAEVLPQNDSERFS